MRVMSFGIVLAVVVLAGLVFEQIAKSRDLKREIARISSLGLEQKKLEFMRLQMKMACYNTNHILHLLLSILTAGIWIVPWVFISWANPVCRKDINRVVGAVST